MLKKMVIGFFFLTETTKRYKERKSPQFILLFFFSFNPAFVVRKKDALIHGKNTKSSFYLLHTQFKKRNSCTIKIRML